jgi:Protein of unknown function (DUF3224)
MLSGQAGKVGTMTGTEPQRTVDAEFEITDWDEVAYDEPKEGPKLTKIRFRKTYSGAPRGTGVAHVLTAQGSEGSGYVASERIEAAFDGRHGTFVIQHGGLADREDLSTFGTVVPHSGTRDLSGLSGHAIEARHGVLTLRYTIKPS